MSKLKYFIVTVERRTTVRIPVRANNDSAAARLADALVTAGHYDDAFEENAEEVMSVDETNEMTYSEVIAEED